MSLRSYHDLLAWQKAIDFVVETYKLTGQFPRTQLYGLTAHLQRAAVSIPSNVAEGAGRIHTREYTHHAGIARGSLFEAETQIIGAQRLGYGSAEDIRPLLCAISEIGRLLHGPIASLERKVAPDGC